MAGNVVNMYIGIRPRFIQRLVALEARGLPANRPPIDIVRLIETLLLRSNDEQRG